MLIHTDNGTYIDLCKRVDELTQATGLHLVIGYVGDLETRWNGAIITDDRLWTVWIDNACTRSGNKARFGLHRTKNMQHLIDQLTLERLSNIVRHAVPVAVTVNDTEIVTYTESVQLLAKL